MSATVTHLSDEQVRAVRMRSLLLEGRHPHTTVGGLIGWMGALQAQDHASSLWSLGIRLPDATVQTVMDALERREALRTWPMRGTVHLVAARDAHWMLDLMSARPLASARLRQEALGLTPAVVDAATEALVTELSGQRRLTRAACIEVMQAAGAPATSGVAYHLLWFAAQRGITCIAPHVDGEQTFVLLDDWVSDPHRPSRDEALARIALRYVRSHGPVTDKELARWTGLALRDSRAGIADAGDALVSVGTDQGPMLVAGEVLDAAFPATGASSASTGEAWWAMPSFDEYLLGYGDRDLMLEPALREAVIPGNRGVFRWTLVREGQVVGTFSRTARTRDSRITAVDLVGLSARERALGERALAEYGRFLGTEIDVYWTSP